MQRTLNWLAWLGVAIVFIAAPVRILGWMEVFPVSARLDQYAMYASWAGLALVVAYALQSAWTGGRNSRYGMLALVSVGVGLAILVAVNYVASRQNKRWDFTANQQFTLSEQTTKLLQGLTAPAKLLVFDRARGFERFRARMNSYEAVSKNVTVEYVDVDRFPIRAREYDVAQYGTVVVEYMGRKERATSDEERDITTAFIKTVNPAKHKVYFLAGHGERDIKGPADEQGLNSITEALGRDNYEFDTLVLAQANAIPNDATVLVVAGPRNDLLERELPLLETYLDKGGKLLVLIDPPSDLKAADPTPRLVGLLAKWGIKATSSVILSGSTNDPFTPAAAVPYPTHPITDRFRLLTVFSLVRAVQPEGAGRDGHAAQPFVQTGANSWAETDLAKFDPNALTPPDESTGDILGPVTIGAAVAVPVKAAEPVPTPAAATGDTAKPAPPETRIAAIGDSEFVTNQLAGVPGNVNLFMNTVNWLAQQENMISIRPRDPAERRLAMDNRQMVMVLVFSVLIVPIAVFGGGFYAWWRRR